MDALTLVPVFSYLDPDIDTDRETVEMEDLCAYFSTDLFNQLLENVGEGYSRFAVLGNGGIVNDKVRYCDNISIRGLQIYSILWQQYGTCFSGIACSRSCKPTSLFPYIYQIMTGVPAKSMTVVLIAPDKNFKVINFDNSFPEWYRKNNPKN